MTTVDPSEIEKFSRLAAQWWDPNGPFKPLHAMTSLRLEYVLSHMPGGGKVPCSVLDVGCGGGLVAEPLARMGMRVVGIDASEKNIAVARLHAAQGGLEIDYRCTPLEVVEGVFDVVLALEILEHVADVPAFVQAVMARVAPGGRVIFSTINRTARAYMLAVIAAEYVLRWLPVGTHDWHKFVTPYTLLSAVEASGGVMVDMTGMTLHSLTRRWQLAPTDVRVNYCMVAARAA